MEYIAIDKVLTFLPKNLIEEENDNVQIISWALQALRMLNIIQKYERKICVLEVKNHKVKLPKGVNVINEVRYLQNTCCKEDLNSLIYDIKETYDESCSETSEGLCKMPITYAVWFGSNYYQNNYKPLKYDGIGKDWLSNCFTNQPCQHTFTITPDGYLYTDIKDCYISLDYDSEIQDSNGNFLVPDDVDLFRYIAEYIKMSHFENRSINHEETTYNKYEKHQVKTEILYKKVKGKFLLKGIKPELIYKIQFSQLYSIYLPMAFARRNEGY